MSGVTVDYMHCLLEVIHWASWAWFSHHQLQMAAMSISNWIPYSLL